MKWLIIHLLFLCMINYAWKQNPDAMPLPLCGGLMQIWVLARYNREALHYRISAMQRQHLRIIKIPDFSVSCTCVFH